MKESFRTTALALAAAALLLPVPVRAALLQVNDPVFGVGQDGFNITRDTASGLDWLDVSITDGLPFDVVDAGALTPAWRRATLAEVIDLYGNAGLVHPVLGTVLTDLVINLGNGDLQPDDAGLTFAQYEQIRDDALVLKGLLGDTGGGGIVAGTVADFDPQNPAAHQTALLRFTFSVVAGGGIIGIQIAAPDSFSLGDSTGSGLVGHFLVRDTPSALAEPGALGLALVGLIGAARRSRTRRRRR